MIYGLHYFWLFKINPNKDDSRFYTSAAATCFIISIHFLLIVKILELAFSVKLLHSIAPDLPYVYRKWTMAPIVFFLMYLTHRFYRKRFDTLVEKHGDKKLSVVGYFLYMTILMIVPLIVLIKLS